MSDLGAVVKDAAEDAAQAGEKAGKAIMEHFEGIGSELKCAAGRYRSVESDAEKGMKDVLDGGAKDAENAAGQVGKDTAKSVDDLPHTGDDGVGEGDVEDDFRGGDEGGHDSEGGEETEGASDPVDVVSGQMLTSSTDVQLPGVLDLVLRRAYASSYRHGALFGPGWSSSLDQRLVINDDGIHVLGDDAQVLNYGVPTQPGQQLLPIAGARWPLTWDRTFDVIEVHDPHRGWVLKYPTARHDALGREVRDLARIEDRNGNWIRIERDADGVPTDVSHSGGYRLRIDAHPERDGFRVTALHLQDGTPDGVQLVGYGYDGLGRLSQVTDSSGAPFGFEYDDANRITAWIDRLGHRYDYTYDDAGRVVRGQGPENLLSAEFAYDTAQRITTVTNGLGEATVYHYDEHRHITKIVDGRGGEAGFEHDRYGRLTTRTDALGNVVRYLYDERGDVTEILHPDGSTVRARYNEMHQPIEVHDQAGARWTYAFDERGNLVETVDPLGARATYQYDDHGRLTASIDPSGHTTRYETNPAGLQTALIDPLGAASRTERDAFGHAVALTDPLGHTTRFGFRPEGQALWRELPDGARESWEYDAEGNQVRHTDLAGATTVCEYGPMALRTAEIRPDGARYTFDYDPERNLRAVTGPDGLTWRYEYAPGGLLTRELDFNNRATDYGYDATGRLIERTNAAGQRVTLTRDTHGRVTHRDLGQDAQTTFAYDAAGRLVRAEAPHALLEYAYDAVGRVVSESVEGRAITFTRDAEGRVLQRLTPAGARTAWSYDPNGEPLSLTTDVGSLTIGYDAVGHETSRIIASAAAISQAWDGSHRMTSQALWRYQHVDTPGGEAGGYQPLAQRAYTYRADGAPLALDLGERGSVHYDLDALGRITGLQSPTRSEQYAFDQAGRITRATWDANQDQDVQGEREYQGSRLTRAGSASFEYDQAGRVVRKIRRTLSGQRRQWTYTWDADDRLTEIHTPDGAHWRYRYDALGRRIAKQQLDEDGAVIDETVFTWENTRVTEQTRRAPDGVTHTLTWDWEPGTDRVAAQTRTNRAAHASQEEIDREFHAIVTDRAGTPTELIGTDGQIAWQAGRTLWGVPEAEAGGDASGEAGFPLRFPGQYHDEESGLDYNYLRYYDPQTARYLTADPLGLFPQPDDYGYTDNPLILIDPLGLARQPHYANVSVYDPQNNLKYAYSLRSGNQLPQEAALGFPNNAMASHTEVRATRIHGGSPTVPIANDPIANIMPVNPGDRIEIDGTKPPCPQCRGAMNRAVNELGVSVNYNWGGNTWSATG